MKINKLLILVLVLAGVLRLWHLGSNPPHLTPDEASLGYNAYSILKTGRDEYGQLLPIVFKSFGDYKPGLYIYATIPFVGILGLNEFSVRLPSVIAGTISVLLVFLIVKELFKNEKLALISLAVAAINPWLIYFSRGAWEVNLSLTLTLAGIYFFLRSLRNSRFLPISAIFFGSTLLAYQGAKLSTVIVVVILGTLYFKELLKVSMKDILLAIAVGLIVSFPIILSMFMGKAGRLTVFSVFSYRRPEKYLQDFLDQGRERVEDVSYYLFHNEIVNFLRGIMGRYFNHFSERFLFFEGDWANPRHSAPNVGVFIFADLLLMISGCVCVLKRKISREVLFVVLWLFLAPLPSVLSRDQVHAVRSFNMVIPLVVLSVVGIFGIFQILKKYKIGMVLFGLLYFVNYLYFLDAYFVHLPVHGSKYWQYGYKQIVQVIAPIQQNYKQIKVQQSYEQPYIYFLFFEKYDPARYQASAKLAENKFGDVGQVEKLDNIEFSAIDWPINRGDHGSLVVGDPVAIPREDSSDERQFRVIDEIKYLNGRDVAFRIIEVK